MFRPDDPLAPRGATFDEPWQAQVLALADAMVARGHFTAPQWAEALGACLRQAEASGEPDTGTTYYTAAITALERLSAARAGISRTDQKQRKQDWEEAYEHTPHGQPVVLGAAVHGHLHDHD